MPHTLGTILTGWRENTKLTQAELSALTYEVADQLRQQGHEDSTGLMRQYIGQIEKGNIKEPHPRILRVLAYTYIEALRRRGREVTVDGETLLHVFTSNLKPTISSSSVSSEAAELDSYMMMIKEPLRHIMYLGMIAAVRAQIDAWIKQQENHSNERE